jgi:hypothetical protein
MFDPIAEPFTSPSSEPAIGRDILDIGRRKKKLLPLGSAGPADGSLPDAFEVPHVPNVRTLLL